MDMLVDAKSNAIKWADKSGLPQTVYYHADDGMSHTNALANRLHERNTELFVTYLPSYYFRR